MGKMIGSHFETQSASARQNAPAVVLLVGSMAQRALQDVGPQSLGEALRIVALADAARAIGWMEQEQAEPALLILCPSRPGEIDEREVFSLRRAAPLARVCAVLPSWCEGETRSGRPWPGVWRIYQQDWPQRGARELAALAAGRPTVWNLPATATAEEQLLAEMELVAHRSRASKPSGAAKLGTVAVLAATVEAGQALADACRSLGYEPIVWRRLPAEGELAVRALLWDTTAEMAARGDLVQRLSAAGQGAPIVALLGFPRPEQAERARQAGVAAVLSKPLLLADLEWQLAALVS
jgi:hypothetical protein